MAFIPRSTPAADRGVASPGAPHIPWTWRLREILAAYLPLLLMLMLALSTWWLVKNTPTFLPPREAPLPRHEPDYTMQSFAVERFGPNGALRIRIEGEQARHYPDTDTLEIDQVRIHAIGEAGRVTNASSRRAVSNGDGSEVQLLGGARVDSLGLRGEPIHFEGEFLHAFLATERVRSHLPVVVRQGTSVVRADGMEYDNLSQVVQFKGHVRATLTPLPAGTK
ncbi:MAG TPA: LPS export ABC transporter periplasmic protein LptC [Burkholderiaceae bacterium]|nr:LPS export ABC transporter periplasmic protein LptC [Burkholderiaceae bacterium]